ncbi:GNAT family N-acetyltransferase [Ramlibacter sp. AN1015]|uniref:GNAT family N-acetyltransferase n=1 Tax=Ramlibacter sp. AN1015 TaxID=3133428 RepID=UPI0030C158D7
MKNDDLEFSDNAAAQRYELQRGTEVLASAAYRLEGGRLHFTHTEVPPQQQGQGLASRLARDALDDVRRRGLKAVPACAFIAAYVRRHPEYADLL